MLDPSLTQFSTRIAPILIGWELTNISCDLYSTSVGGKDLSNDAQIRVISLMEPEILCTKMLKTLSEKLRAKFPATTHGYPMVKFASLDDTFLEVFLNCKQAQ